MTPVLTLEEVAKDPHCTARRVTVDGPEGLEPGPCQGRGQVC